MEWQRMDRYGGYPKIWHVVDDHIIRVYIHRVKEERDGFYLTKRGSQGIRRNPVQDGGTMNSKDMLRTEDFLEHREAQKRRHTGWCIRPEGGGLLNVHYYMDKGNWQFSVYNTRNTWMWYHDGKKEGEELAANTLEEAMRLAYTLWRMGE